MGNDSVTSLFVDEQTLTTFSDTVLQNKHVNAFRTVLRRDRSNENQLSASRCPISVDCVGMIDGLHVTARAERPNTIGCRSNVAVDRPPESEQITRNLTLGSQY